MIHRSLAILVVLGAATILGQSLNSRTPFALAAFWRSGTMTRATRRQRTSPVKSSIFVTKDLNKVEVIPPKTSSALFVKPPTATPSSLAPPPDSLSLLQNWASHSHADYHNFTDDEAAGIRLALLEWYQGNRRKLPWRGDPPPFDGSTSGINSNTKKRSRSEASNAATKKTKGDQKSIKSFFSSTKTGQKSKPIKTEPKPDESTSSSSEPLLDQAIPVTGYGVWVSEIMLQQTRVEAVIPFWIKCKLQ